MASLAKRFCFRNPSLGFEREIFRCFSNGRYEQPSGSAGTGSDAPATIGVFTAELSFGFWTALFNRKAFPDVSKPLMRVFHHCPKHSKNADAIRSRLNNARDLRNRCFHHEPLLWRPIYNLHRDITEIVQWIDPALCTWIKTHDRLPAALTDWNNWKEVSRRAAASPVAKVDTAARP